jgi:HSP20 family molecular chaperone IbpA
MASFFEKLKRGMGVVESGQNEMKDEVKPEEQLEQKPPAKPRKKRQKKEPADAADNINEEKTPIEPEIKKTEEKEIETKNNIMQEKEEVKIATQEETEPRSEGREKEKKWPSFSKDQEGQLAIDVYQTEEFLVIQSAIAGIKPDSLDIVIEGDMVSIKGNREKPEEKGDRNYFYQECFWGPFSRQIILSLEVDPARAEALLKDGILTIKLPKIERDKKRKLVVKG